MFSENTFETPPTLSEESKIVFVSDFFIDDYVGGAELTTDAIIKSCPVKYDTLKSNEVTMELLRSGYEKYWVFGNFANLNFDLIPTIIANIKYSVLEYDYKFCKYRSVEKHMLTEQTDCDCHNDSYGKIVSAFMHGAVSSWWMSEKQFDIHCERFPFYRENNATILSSVFHGGFFEKLHEIRNRENYGENRNGWIVLGSTSWVKGRDAALKWCEENDKEHEVIWDIPYDDVIERLATAEGFVYLPAGSDTCPRMVIEAKLLGCKIVLNEHVQHKDELWFNTDNQVETESYLYAARERFWSAIKSEMDYNPTLSGYTTTLNCIKHNYPWRETITSMLGFCDDVVVVDGGSDDGTWEQLEEWAESETCLSVHKVSRNWNHERFAVFDGAQKAEARTRCSGNFCWQQDADEVVHESDYEKIRQMVRNFPRHADLMCLPVIEYWGGPNKVRCDINPWKWRLSRNKDVITHGIPRELQVFDDAGHIYASPGTDGCDYVHANTFERIPHLGFYTKEIDDCRNAAVMGDETSLEKYGAWYKNVTELLPSVHHYSWFNLPRKIKTYRDYWSKHWQSLYNIEQEDTSENNMFFDKSWSNVSDDDIKTLSERLSKEMGGWVFHTKVDFSKKTPHISLPQGHPSIIQNWVEDAKK